MFLFASKSLSRASCLVLCFLIVAVHSAYGQILGNTLDLHDFDGASNGGNAYASVTPDVSGNLYGTTQNGGAHLNGMVWEITAAGTFKDLHDFAGSPSDGLKPQAEVTIDSHGNLFGTTVNGGQNGEGVIWEIPSAGAYKIVHDFGSNLSGTALDGQYPSGAVKFDASGNLYGVTSADGTNDEGGTLYEITSGGLYQIVHTFGSGTDGASPSGSVAFDSKGNLYGTTLGGGLNSAGIVWEYTTAGVYSDAHDFGGQITVPGSVMSPDGYDPFGAVAFDKAGNMYGTLSGGGLNGAGAVWMISTSKVYSHIHDFGNPDIADDGNTPFSGVAIDVFGAVYGTTYYGGSKGQGVLWQYQPGKSFMTIHSFGTALGHLNLSFATDGVNPYGVPVFDTNDHMYGTTFGGGANGIGVVWEQDFDTEAVSLTVSPNTVVGGTNSTATVTLNRPSSPEDYFVGMLSSSSSAQVFSGLYIAMGSKSGSIPITTSGVTSATTTTITANGGDFSGVFDTLTATLTIEPNMVSSVALSPNSVIGGGTVTGTVTLNGPAPTGGIKVNLSSSSSAATLPSSSVTIAAGASSGKFTVNTVSVRGTISPVITAKYGSSSKTATLTVEPALVSSVSVAPTSVIGGVATVGTVKITGPAPAGGLTIFLSSNSPDVIVSSSALIPAGSTSVTFPAKTAPVAAAIVGVISARSGTVTKTASLTVEPATLVSVTLSPTSVQGSSATAVTGTVTLSGDPPSGNFTVTLKSSNSAAASVPPTVVVHSGNTKSTFTVAHIKVTSSASVTITATLAGLSKTATLTVTP